MKKEHLRARALAGLARARARRGSGDAAPAAHEGHAAGRDGGDVPVPAHLEVDPRGREGLRDQHHVLADRLGRRHRGDHRPDRRLRRLRCTAVRRSARRLQGLRRDPVGARGYRRSRTTCRGSTAGCSSTAPTLANIYLGKITNWNDAAIKRLNPKLNLPNTKITPVYRSDGSGTTYAFTEYLSPSAPRGRADVGINTSVNFPTGVGARGSSGVAGVVKKTAGRADLRGRRVLDPEQAPVRARSRTAPGSSPRRGSGDSSRRSRSCRGRSRASRS